MKSFRLGLLALTAAALLVNAQASKTTPRLLALMDADCVCITMNNTLVFFSSESPEQVISEMPLTGLLSGETIVALEFVPSSEMAFGYSNRGRLYRINLANGIVTSVGFDPPFSQSEIVSIVFDPSINKIRLITNTGHHFAVDPATGNVVALLGPLMYQDGDPNFPQTPQIEGAALPFTTLQGEFDSTFPFLIDLKTLSLVKLGKGGNNPVPADSGKISTVGQLGVNISSSSGFDISRDTNGALAALILAGESSPRLFRINLVSGFAIEIGPITPTKKIVAFTTIKAINNASALFNPAVVSGVIGQEKTVTAKVLFNGKPGAGINVEFNITNGPNKGVRVGAVTDNAGAASFKYRSNGQVGTDIVTISGQVASTSFSSTGTVIWEDRPLISEVRQKGKNIIIDGFNFRDDDQVSINDKVQKVTFNDITQLKVKKGKKALLECTNGTPVENIIRVFRNPSSNPSPPLQDTTAFATCP